MNKAEFESIALDSQHELGLGRLPADLCWTAQQFDAYWALHPFGFHEVVMFGRRVPVPRWSETYGRDYRFAGTIQPAQPIPNHLALLLNWSQLQIDTRFNGLLVNWYDGVLGHRIGAHRDDEKELLVGAPIVTISFGERRMFRLRRWQGEGRHDIEITDASVLVLPHATNLAFTHEVPASKRLVGRRISVTIRAFEN